MDCNPPDSSVHETSQARILEQVAISFSRGSSQPRNRTYISCIGRQFLYHWATKEAFYIQVSIKNPGGRMGWRRWPVTNKQESYLICLKNLNLALYLEPTVCMFCLPLTYALTSVLLYKLFLRHWALIILCLFSPDYAWFILQTCNYRRPPAGSPHWKPLYTQHHIVLKYLCHRALHPRI